MGKKAKLTLDDFKSDYQHMVVRHTDPGVRDRVAHRMIDNHYSHVAAECRRWLADRKQK